MHRDEHPVVDSFVFIKVKDKYFLQVAYPSPRLVIIELLKTLQ